MHVFLEWAHFMKGIGAFWVKVVPPAVKAGGRAVTEDGGGGVVAVGGLVFGHGVATVPAVPTTFV